MSGVSIMFQSDVNLSECCSVLSGVTIMIQSDVNRGSKKCPKHDGKEVIYYCKNCGILVCANCVIQECQGHVFEGISNVIPTSKQKLQDFIAKAELTEIPSIKSELQAADSDLIKNKTHFKNQIRKIRKQNEAIKKELDKITETFVKTYQDMEQQYSDEIPKYMRDLQTRIDTLASQIQDVKGALQSTNDILVFDMSHVIQLKFDDLHSKPVCNTPEFTQGKLSLHALEQLLGKLNISVQTQSLNQSGNWKVKSEFTPHPGYGVRSIHAVTAVDQVWLSFFKMNTEISVEKMLLTDQSGQVKQTLDMDVPVRDFCSSPVTGDIWFCNLMDNSVREVRGSKSIIRFTTNMKPWCICVTKDDHIIIGHHGEIVKYTEGGRVICRTSGRNRSVVRFPWHLSQCPLTSNIAVVDDNWKEHGGNGEPFVSVLNDQLQLLYTYTGNIQGQQSPAKPFNPYDVCYTVTGELVITDFDNNSVLLVTGTGRYLTTLYTHRTSRPYAVGVQGGVIWMSFYDGSVQVLQNI